MSLQSSVIKLSGTILERVLTLQKTPLMSVGLRVSQQSSREPLKKSAFCHLGIVADPKRSLHTKNHVHTQPQS